MSVIHPWYDEVLARAKEDRWHQKCLDEVERLSPMFEKLRKSLSSPEQEVLDFYISACEQLESSFVYPAYQVGRCHGICSKIRENP